MIKVNIWLFQSRILTVRGDNEHWSNCPITWKIPHYFAFSDQQIIQGRQSIFVLRTDKSEKEKLQKTEFFLSAIKSKPVNLSLNLLLQTKATCPFPLWSQPLRVLLVHWRTKNRSIIGGGQKLCLYLAAAVCKTKPPLRFQSWLINTTSWTRSSSSTQTTIF